MTKAIYSNPCILCGKQRVVAGVKKEYVNGSLVTTQYTVCPDKDCQKRLELRLAKEKKQREEVANNKLQQELERAKEKLEAAKHLAS